MSGVIHSEQIYTLTDYGARAAVGIVDRKSPWPQDLNDDEKQALRRLQRDKCVTCTAKPSNPLLQKKIVNLLDGFVKSRIFDFC